MLDGGSATHYVGVMKTILPLILALSTGCAFSLSAPDDSMAMECYIDGLKVVRSLKDPISCANFSTNVSLARDLMIEYRFVADQADFNRWYQHVEIDVDTEERCLEGPHIGLLPLPGCIYGQYWATGYGDPAVEALRPASNDVRFQPHLRFHIEINHDGGALAHEFLHHWDTTHGREELTHDHTDWGQLGYYALSDDYKRSVLPIALP